METANFLQELCLRAEEKVAAAGGCPAELLACPSTSAEGPSCNQDGGRNNRGVLNDADDDDVERHGWTETMSAGSILFVYITPSHVVLDNQRGIKIFDIENEKTNKFVAENALTGLMSEV